MWLFSEVMVASFGAVTQGKPARHNKPTYAGKPLTKTSRLAPYPAKLIATNSPAPS